MLLDHASAKKTGALAASITLQAIAVGVLIVIPMIYGDRLRLLQPEALFSIPLSAPSIQRTVRSAEVEAARPSILPSRVFRLPANSSSVPAATVLIDSAVPSIGDVGGVPGLVSGTVLPALVAIAPARREPVAVAVEKTPEKPLPVGGDVQAAKLIRKIIPQYPPLARAARISGTVHLMGIVAKDGTIQRIQVVSGNPLLIHAAVEAVRQWVYRPTLLNGQAIEVVAPIEVIFTLSQ